MPFDNLLDEAARLLQQRENLHLVTHTDADGLCATAILLQACKEMGKSITIHYLDQVSALAFRKLGEQIEGPVMLVDIGSSHLEVVEGSFKGDLLILDHHQAQGSPERALFVNPTLHGMDGTREACAASIAWHVASKLTDAVALSPIALIGVQADHQPYESLNATVLECATKNNLATLEEGARVHGRMVKPLVPLIAGSYDLAIPGVTRNPQGAARLLAELGIPEKSSGVARLYGDLSSDERKRLDGALVAKSPHPEPKIVHCTLKLRGPLGDTREAATLVNACGRSGKPELGVRALLENNSELAEQAQRAYQGALREAHEWAKRNAIGRKGLLVIRGGDVIPPWVAGALCSVFVRGREVPDGTTVICLARNADGTTKVSGRTAGDQDLATLIGNAAKSVGGEGGGHAVAAGAVIPSEREEEFLAAL